MVCFMLNTRSLLFEVFDKTLKYDHLKESKLLSSTVQSVVFIMLNKRVIAIECAMKYLMRLFK